MDDVLKNGENTPKRIGIMTCSNITQDLSCASSLCLKDLRSRRGKFAIYDDVELVGIINCAGCPGILGASKLTNRIRSLTELKVDAIHFSSCVIDFCPFVEKYHKMIKEQYPHIEVAFGTHDPPEGITPQLFIEVVKDLFNKGKPDLTDLVKTFAE